MKEIKKVKDEKGKKVGLGSGGEVLFLLKNKVFNTKKVKSRGKK